MRHQLLILAGLAGFVLAVSGCTQTTHADPAPTGNGITAFRSEQKGEAAGGGPETAGGTGWAGIKGTFVLEGAIPTLKPLSTGGKDGEVCDSHAIPDERLVVCLLYTSDAADE